MLSRAVLLHLALAAPAVALCFGMALLVAGADPAQALRTLANLPGQFVDERTRRFVLCLGIPIVALPVLNALLLAPEAIRRGPSRIWIMALRVSAAGLVATAAFHLAVTFALATAPSQPSIVSRNTLRNAWLLVLTWSLAYAPVACVIHAATLPLLGRANRRKAGA